MKRESGGGNRRSEEVLAGCGVAYLMMETGDAIAKRKEKGRKEHRKWKT